MSAANSPPSSRPHIRLPPPPALPERDDAAGSLVGALPMVGSLGSILLVTTMVGTSGPHRLVAAGLFGLTTLAFVAIQFDRQRTRRQRRIDTARTAYLHRLADVRRLVREEAELARTTQIHRHPDPGALPLLVPRTATDKEGLEVRYGLGTQPAALELRPPPEPSADGVERLDPAAVAAAERLVAAHRWQPGLPATADLRTWHRIEICGEEEAARSAARAMICAGVSAYPPTRLAIALLAAPSALPAWEWLKWLPHLDSVATALDEVDEHLMSRGPEAHVLLVVDGVHAAHDFRATSALTVLDLPFRWGEVADQRCLRLEIGSLPRLDGRYPAQALSLGTDAEDVVLDQCSVATAEALARGLCSDVTDASERQSSGFAELLGLGGLTTFDPGQAWAPRPEHDRLRIPIGRDEAGDAVHLDLKESAQQGMGPHGLVVGATGSGKSEFLRTLVLGLALTHPPDDLNLVLVDFKGGATFAGMSDLPHVAAVITNLADDLALVDRMQDALEGELARRQELLHRADHATSLAEYARARDREPDAELPALPSLLIVVDEFSELLAAKPEFIDLFVAIGRLGRSLGLHLLLASQRLDEGRLRGLEAHLSYRIGLRTFSAAESRAVLGVPDAYELPPVPGMGYLKAAPTELVRFVGEYVSGPLDDSASATAAPQSVEPFTLDAFRLARPDAAPRRTSTERGSLLSVAVARMAGQGRAAHRIWLPPLESRESVEALAVVGSHGIDRVVVGMVDRPRRQRRDPLVLDLSGAGGHVAVVGGPRSGKSSLLGTIITSLALTASPQARQFYVIDLAGGGIGPALNLPHVAGRAGPGEPDVAARIVAEVGDLADAREARGAAAEDDHGEVFVVVDGWGALRGEFDDLEMGLARLAARGLAVGVHLIVATNRWSDFRITLRDLLGTRLELRLGDALESEVDRRLASSVPHDRPGRGLTTEREHFLAATPTDEAVVARVRATWAGGEGPKLRMLPQRVPLETITASVAGLRLGIEERRLAPVTLAPEEARHLVVYGDAGAGKTTVLRTLAHEIARVHTPQQAQILLIDPRRTLVGEVGEPYVLNHLTSVAQIESAVTEIAGRLAGRLGARATGPDLFVLVDDHDLLGGGTSPLAALVPLLGHAQDIGLHLVITRRVGGATRAAYEPLLASLRDLGAAGLLLSGGPDEGPLLAGLRPTVAPPGRGRLVTRAGGVQVVQVAWTEPRD